MTTINDLRTPAKTDLRTDCARAIITFGGAATETMIERVMFTAQVHIRTGYTRQAAIAEGIATHFLGDAD